MKINFKKFLIGVAVWILWSGWFYLFIGMSIKEPDPVIPISISLVCYIVGLYFMLKDVLSDDVQLNKQEVKTNGNN